MRILLQKKFEGRHKARSALGHVCKREKGLLILFIMIVPLTIKIVPTVFKNNISSMLKSYLSSNEANHCDSIMY